MSLRDDAGRLAREAAEAMASKVAFPYVALAVSSAVLGFELLK